MVLHVYGLSVRQGVEAIAMVVGLAKTPKILVLQEVPTNLVILMMTTSQNQMTTAQRHKARPLHHQHQPSLVDQVRRARRVLALPLQQLLGSLARRIVRHAIRILRTLK